MRCEALATRGVAGWLIKLFHRRANPGREGARVTAICVGVDVMLLHLVVCCWHDMRRTDQCSPQVSWRGAVASERLGACHANLNRMVSFTRLSSENRASEGPRERLEPGWLRGNEYGARLVSG